MKGRPVDVELFIHNMFRTKIISSSALNEKSTNVMPNLIRYLDESYRNCTVTAFHQVDYDQSLGRITVTIYTLDVPEDGIA